MPIRTDREGAARVLVLDAPPGNRLSLDDVLALRDAILLPPAPADRVVLLRGAGADFCLGRASGPAPDGPFRREAIADHLLRPVASLFAAVRASSLPVVAVVRGGALGLGCALAGTCDVTLAHPDAGFALPDMERDLPPTLSMTALLGRVAPKVLSELVLSRRVVGAAEARALGLVSRVTPEPQAAAHELAAALALNSRESLVIVKRFLAATAYAGQPTHAELATELLAAALA